MNDPEMRVFLVMGITAAGGYIMGTIVKWNDYKTTNEKFSAGVGWGITGFWVGIAFLLLTHCGRLG